MAAVASHPSSPCLLVAPGGGQENQCVLARPGECDFCPQQHQGEGVVEPLCDWEEAGMRTVKRPFHSRLSKNTSQKAKHIPYRDSKLTFILANAFGGNSRTAMVCCMSESSWNAQESLSTLRFGERYELSPGPPLPPSLCACELPPEEGQSVDMQSAGKQCVPASEAPASCGCVT